MYTVLYVDDEPGLLEVGKLFLEQSGQFSVDTITSAPAALALLQEKIYDAIISDYQMPVMDGIGFLKKVRSSGNTIPFILFTGRGREEVVIEALNCGADSYLQKGGQALPQYAELEHRILEVVQRHQVKETLLESEARFQQLTEHGGIVIWEIDPDGLFTYVSVASDAVWGGYHPDELIGRKFFYDLTPEAERESFK